MSGLPGFGINQVKSGLEAKFFELCDKLVSENDLSLYDLDYISSSHTLRVFIMNPETQSAVVEDCIKIDHALTPYVEEADWMPEELTVEVSSPGIFRALKTTEHFEWSVGERISVTVMGNLASEIEESLPKSLKGQKKFTGELDSVNESNIELNVEDKNKKILVPIEFSLIKKAQLEPKF